MTEQQTRMKERFDHEAAKQTLKEKYEAKMLFAAFGGMWKAGPELLTFLYILKSPNNDAKTVLIDQYENPCEVVIVELFDLAKERWQEQMNAWHFEYEQLMRQR